MLTKQIKIGITGGSGCGKSTVCSFLADLNIPIYGADREAKIIMQTDLKIITEMLKVFGKGCYDIPYIPYKRKEKYLAYLNSDYLGNIVFNNSDKLKKLNEIVHPPLIQHYHNWCIENNSKIIILDSAIIFETELKNHLDYIICVTAPIEIRIERLMKRDGLPRESILKRISSQLSEDEKIKKSDFIINNDNNMNIISQTLSIIERIYQKENISI